MGVLVDVANCADRGSVIGGFASFLRIIVCREKTLVNLRYGGSTMACVSTRVTSLKSRGFTESADLDVVPYLFTVYTNNLSCISLVREVDTYTNAALIMCFMH